MDNNHISTYEMDYNFGPPEPAFERTDQGAREFPMEN